MTETESRSRWRPRFSLRTALLLITIAGLAMTVVQLWREVGPLRAEVRRLRDETGELSIDDPSKLHAIQVRKTNELVWKWRLWIPEGRTYLLRSNGDIVPKTGFPDDGGTMWIREPGEMWVEYRITKDPRSGTWRGSMATQSGSVGSREQPWVEWQRRAGASEGVGTSTHSADAGATLLLMRQRFGQAVKSSDDIPDPAPGFMIWLEPAK